MPGILVIGLFINPEKPISLFGEILSRTLDTHKAVSSFFTFSLLDGLKRKENEKYLSAGHCAFLHMKSQIVLTMAPGSIFVK